MTTDIREEWVSARGVRFHYLEGGERGNGTPAVYVPGFLADAEWFRTEMERLDPRHTISISLRGRGKSGAPETGYSFDDQTEDLAAVISALDLPPLCLIGFSVGVAFALRYAQDHPDSIAGLVIQDWPAHYLAQTTGWMENAIAKRLGSEHVIRAIQRESGTVDLWDGLGKLKCPVLIMRGGLPGSLLSHEHAQRYQSSLPQAEIVEFENAGHYVWHPDYEEFFTRISSFLATLDASEH